MSIDKILDQKEELITQDELLEMAGITRNTLYRDIQSGKISCIKFNGQKNRFYKSEALDYVEQKKSRGIKKVKKKEKNPVSDELISQKELCDLIKLSRFSIYRAIKDGKIHPVKIKGYRDNFFEKSEIKNMLNEK